MIPPHFRVVCLPRCDAKNIFISADLSWTANTPADNQKGTAATLLPGRTQEEQSGPKAACDLLRLLHRECTDILYHSVVQELHRSREKASEDHQHSSEVPTGLVYLQLPHRISRILVLTCLTCCPLPGTSSPSNQGQTDSETVSSAITTLNLNMQTLNRHYHLLFLQEFLSPCNITSNSKTCSMNVSQRLINIYSANDCSPLHCTG